MLTNLSLATLDQLDMGKVDVAFKAELRRVVADMADRPGDKSTRKVSVTLKLTPEMNEHGICETTKAEFVIDSSVPKRHTREYSMKVHPRGGLSFNTESDDNVRQGTLDEVIDE